MKRKNKNSDSWMWADNNNNNNNNNMCNPLKVLFNIVLIEEKNIHLNYFY